jgi:hypothetical protein
VHYILRIPCFFGKRIGKTGDILSIVYSAECKAAQKANESVRLLPILVVLFVFSYAILTALVFEQGKTIESQRALIREMLKDSTQLAELKGKIARDESLRAQQKSLQGVGPSAPAQQGPSSVDPKNSSKDSKANGKSAHVTKEAPRKPASDLEDVRRLTNVI